MVPAITGQNAEYYHTSILKRCNSRSSLSLLSGVIAIFLNITLFGISWLSRYEGEAWVLVLAKERPNAIFNIKLF